MTKQALGKIRICWVRSGIGFSYHAKEAVRSLGLRRLHHIVERPDTPQIRGLVAKVSRLVEIVSDVPKADSLPGPEYTIGAVEAVAAPAPRRKAVRAEKVSEARADAPVAAEKAAAPAESKKARSRAEAAEPTKPQKPAKRAAAAKPKGAPEKQATKKRAESSARKAPRSIGAGKGKK